MARRRAEAGLCRRYLVRNISQVQDYTNYSRDCTRTITSATAPSPGTPVFDLLLAEHELDRGRAQHPRVTSCD